MQRKGPPRDAAKERFWRKAVRQQQRSGQSIRDYCRANRISEPSFYAWRRELKRRGGQSTVRRMVTEHGRAGRGQRRLGRPSSRGSSRSAFVSVQLAPGTVPIGSTSIECLLPGGIVLRLPAGMDPAAIAAVLRSWERSPC